MNANSLEAYASLGKSAATLREMAYQFIKSQGENGAIAEEVERALETRRSTATARIWELHNEGRIIRTDQRRKTTSGRWASVLVAADFLPPETQPAFRF